MRVKACRILLRKVLTLLRWRVAGNEHYVVPKEANDYSSDSLVCAKWEDASTGDGATGETKRHAKNKESLQVLRRQHVSLLPLEQLRLLAHVLACRQHLHLGQHQHQHPRLDQHQLLHLAPRRHQGRLLAQQSPLLRHRDRPLLLALLLAPRLEEHRAPAFRPHRALLLDVLHAQHQAHALQEHQHQGQRARVKNSWTA